jgi:hypothetical protein
MKAWRYLSGVKKSPGFEADRLTLSSAMVKKGRATFLYDENVTVILRHLKVRDNFECIEVPKL